MDNNTRRRSRLPVVVMMVSAAGLMAACGNGDAEASGKVATIVAATPAASASTAAGAAAGKRPQLRLDSSLDDEFRFEQAWYACWKKNGAPVDVAGADQTPEGVTPQGTVLQPNFHK